MTTRSSRPACAALLSLPLLLPACTSLFETPDETAVPAGSDRLREIERVQLEDRLRQAPMTLAEATERFTDEEVAQRVANLRAAAGERIDLTLEEARAAALANNLDLQVQLLSPAIAQTSVDEEQARFESVFTAAVSRTVTDSPTSLATEGSMATFDSYSAGVQIPLRTGGSISLELPFSRTETNNLFSTLDPAFNSDLRFSISQPLLRGAGTYANTHSIRVAQNQSAITEAQTKLEAIRVIAAADRAYWALYAAQRELDVALQQYDLAQNQIEAARNRQLAGVAAEIDVVRAMSGLAERLAAIINADNAIRRSERDLKRVMNRTDLPLESPQAIVLKTAPDPVGLDLDPEELTTFALDRRMEMLELELQLAIDASSIDFEKNARLPSIVVDYAYGSGGLGGSFDESFDQLGEFDFEDWSLGLRAEIPIGNEAAKARVHRAILNRAQRLATKAQRATAIRQEVYDATDALRQNWQRILAARQEVMLAERTLLGEQNQFRNDVRTSTDVLDAATRLAEAQSREILALTDYQIAQVDIAVATGTLLGYGKVRWEPIDVAEE
jgi:outer membrane protein TolC